MTDHPANQLAHFTILEQLTQPDSLCPSSVLKANTWVKDASKVFGAYIHVPFCFHKCHYCDFFSIAGKEDQYQEYLHRLVKELQFVGPKMSELKTIFIGGGTPTLLPPKLLHQMLEAVAQHLPISEDVEYTIEANPETITSQKADIMASWGINRLSIGAQSFDKQLLKILERWHEPNNVKRSMDFARNAGIHNINLDLIHAIPTQTIKQVEYDLRQAMSLSPTHLSCYALTYELNTPLHSSLESGTISRVSHDTEAEMFDVVVQELSSSGYAQYEISNFAKEGHSCEHNIMYWKNKNWWPFGPAASGHIDGRRWRNAPRLTDYLLTDDLPPVQDVECLSEDIQAGEAFMMGLRLLEGMERTWVDDLVDKSPQEWRRGVIERNVAEGMLEWKKEKLALTGKGLHFADTVISELLMRDGNEQ